MANRCGFCEARRPEPTEDFPAGTRIMVLGGEWFEFCKDCGSDERYALTNKATGETKTLSEVWEIITPEETA